MKRFLSEKLSLSTKLRLKRVAFAPVGWVLRLAARAQDFAERMAASAEASGLDPRRSLGARRDVRAPGVEPLSASDFMRLARGASGGNVDEGKAIKTSVVVSVFGEVEPAFQCLRTLLREVDFKDTEVVVVNNSPDAATRELLTRFADLVRVVERDANVVDDDTSSGLADARKQSAFEARNRGAGVARGRFIVFLDGDAQVLPGWLDALVETAERNARAGAVGSLILDASGRVSEAGAVVWSNGETLQYGRGRSHEDRRLLFAREVDYCSGASLLVRKDSFERTGGFDTRYAGAPYADADISMSVRASGLEVIYQPFARIVRREGATVHERFEPDDCAKFCDKWRDALAREHRAKELSNVKAAANRKWATQVAVFDDLIPTPDRDAGSARMMHILRALSEWSHPVFVATGKLLRPDYEKLLWREGIETASALDFERLLKERKFRAAVLSRPAVASALIGPVRRVDTGLKVVYDMLDVHHLRATREAALTGDERAAREAEAYRRIETRTARAADLIWCGSFADKEIMERIAPGVPSVVVPTIHELRAPGPPSDAREHLIFVGSFAHRPNVDAVHFMAREVMPRVRQSIERVELLVVGGGAPVEFAAYAAQGVRVLGYVPDLDPLMYGCRVFVAPIRFGSGVNGKIGEALSYGLPVVTTTIGAEGWGFTPGEQVLIADEADDFAGAVVRLYGDGALWRKLADAGRRHIAENFTPEVIGRVINESLRGDSLLSGDTRREDSDA